MSRNSEKFGDISNASSIITSGRGTSTPINADQPLIMCADLNFRNPLVDAKKSLNFLHPGIEYAKVPIFGRRNLQLLSDCAYEIANVKLESGFSLEAGENTIESPIESIPNTICNEALSSDCSKGKIKESVNTSKKVRNTSKLRASTVKNSKDPRSISRSKTASSNGNKSRRSNQSNPVYKVTPKCSKSPRRLTTIRTKVKERRERIIRKEKMEEKKSRIPVSQNDTENEKYVGTIPKCPKTHSPHLGDTRAELKMKKADSILKHTNGSEKEKALIHKSSLLSSGIRKNTDIKKKTCKTSGITEYLKHKEKNDPDLEKLVVFKARPIRKYASIQPVKPRPITVPESPKIGQRLRLHSCPR